MDDDNAHVADGSRKVGVVVDAARLGRRIRSARTDEGYLRASDFVSEIERVTGMVLTTTVLYALENGERTITFDEMVAMTLALRPHGGLHVFFAAIDSDSASLLLELEGRS